MKVILGTANFNSAYGNNPPSKEEVFNILDSARANGIDTLDTSGAYGGNDWILEWEITRDYYFFKNHKVSGLDELKSFDQFDPYVERLLLHNQDHIYNFKVTAELSFLDANYEALGVSVYDAHNAYEAIQRGFNLVQMQYNLLDVRHENMLRLAKNNSVKTQIRSVFARGILLQDVITLPESLAEIKPFLLLLEEICQGHNVSKKEACLTLIKGNPNIDEVIFGVETAAELEELMLLMSAPVNEPLLYELYHLVAGWDIQLDLRKV